MLRWILWSYSQVFERIGYLLITFIHCMATIQSVELDPCLDDSVEFAKRCRRLGKDVTLDILPGLSHGFLNFALVSSIHLHHFQRFLLNFFVVISDKSRGQGRIEEVCKEDQRTLQQRLLAVKCHCMNGFSSSLFR